MPGESSPTKRFTDLAEEALAFLEEVGGEPSYARRMSEWTWGRLSREQQATAERLGRDLRQQSALLVPEIQGAPLLDKRDLARFAKLGRTMDAALRFESFRTRIEADVWARHVFQDAYRRLRELLDLVPPQNSSKPAIAAESVSDTAQIGNDHHRAAGQSKCDR